MKFINLELKRTSMKGYLMGAAGVFAFGLVMAFAFPFLAHLEEYGADSKDMWIFTTWKGLMVPVSGMVMAGFSILASAMAARIMITEYMGKNAILLFSYPVSRKKILGAKCRLIWGFTAGVTLVSQIIIFLIMGVSSNLLHFVPERFRLEDMGSVLAAGIVLSVLTPAIGQIAMRIGFWKKSPIAAVVACVILICPMTNLFMLGAQSGIFIMLGITVIALAGAVGCYMGLVKKVNEMEV